jgi:hypothetical protein
MLLSAAFVSAQDNSPKVLVGGAGTPQEIVPIVVGKLTDYLVTNKVPAKAITGDLKTKDEYLEVLHSSGGEILLYVSLRTEQPGKRVDIAGYLSVAAYDSKGALRWELNVSRLTCTSAEDMAEQMTKRYLVKHLGGPELPQSK